jgi:hypothetical protein
VEAWDRICRALYVDVTGVLRTFQKRGGVGGLWFPGGIASAKLSTFFQGALEFLHSSWSARLDLTPAGAGLQVCCERPLRAQ